MRYAGRRCRCPATARPSPRSSSTGTPSCPGWRTCCTGDASVADDLAAYALGRVRRDWAGLDGGDPAAAARGLVAEFARRREARWLPDPGRQNAVTDLRTALRRLPHRRRACVVLRYAFALTEDEVARASGISSGSARGRTARGMRQLTGLLGGTQEVTSPGGREAARGGAFDGGARQP